MNASNADQILSGLDPDQRQVATHLNGPLCVIAGAGTGKTRAITHRIAYGVSQGVFTPQHLLAVTFTKKAAAEMGARLRGLGVEGVQTRTFHSAALRQLQYFWPSIVGGSFPQIVTAKTSLLTACASRVGLSLSGETLKNIASELEWCAVSMVDVNAYQQLVQQQKRALPPEITLAKMLDLLELYPRVKRESSVIDFEDCLVLTCGMLEERPDIAHQIRTQYRHFVVDEYQDVSKLQKHLLDLWLGPRNNSLCVVGDAAQTIFSFTGASSKYLLEFKRQFPGAKTVTLNRDYRSTPQIVSLANAVISADPETKKQSVRLKSMRESNQDIRYCRYLDDQGEAEAIAAKIQNQIDAGCDPSRIAILYRINSQSEPFEEALNKRKIPYFLRGTVPFFTRPEVKQAINLVKSTYSGRGTAYLRKQKVDQVFKEAAITLGWTREEPALQGLISQRWQSLNTLVSQAEYKQANGLDLLQVLEEWDELAEAGVAPFIHGVTLCSFHFAKGLEWETVYLTGASEDMLPFSRAESETDLLEERRLCYVGITRARDRLEVSYAQAKEPNRKGYRKCSRFFSPFWPKENSAAERKRREARERQACKKYLNGASERNLNVFLHLRAWRLQVAKKNGTAAFQVFSDHTLRDIALEEPKTLSKLSEIRGIGPRKLSRYGQDILDLVSGQEVEVVLSRTLKRLEEEALPNS